MKKLICLLLTIALCAACAFAAEISPVSQYTFEDGISDGTYRVSFLMEDIGEEAVLFSIYEPLYYSAESVNALAVGDTVFYGDTEVTVESVEFSEETVYINAGSEENVSITLLALDDESYVAIEDETEVYVLWGEAEVSIADQVSVFVNAGAGEADEYTETIAEKANLAASLSDLEAENEFESTVDIVIEEGVVTAIYINYIYAE